MIGWMDDWMIGWMDDWMDGWMDGWMDIWVFRCVATVDAWINRLVEGSMEG